MNSLVPYLMFPGTCEEALNFYKDAFGGEIESINRFEGSPIEVADDYKNKIMHSTFRAGDLLFMASDGMQDNPPAPGSNFALNINFSSEDDQEKVFNKFSEGGNVIMPLQDTFWGAKFGMLTDKYGISWMFHVEKGQE